MRRLLAVTACLGCLLVATAGAQAAEPALPGQPPPVYERFGYPSQIPTGPIEDGSSPPRAGGGFLTLPFLGPHYVTAIFDHCGPDYIPDGRICRYDGRVRSAEGFGEVLTTGKDYLYYDGHDGIDYGLFYEPVAAAADGVVTVADWDRPGCERCGFGLNVFVNHGNGFLTRYGHLYALQVGVGQRVLRGQVLGISGTTGVSTGEHLHFGVYRDRPRLAVDPYGWSGSDPDPWPNNAGNLWQGGAPRFPPVVLPAVAVTAAAVENVPGALDVSWSSPSGGLFDVEVVEDAGRMVSWLQSVAAGSARFQGRPGHSYAFVAMVRTDLGWTGAGVSVDRALGATRLQA
jgi:murein DD-endopeptidase MepM/ murein hydrolase activator NlpD